MRRGRILLALHGIISPMDITLSTPEETAVLLASVDGFSRCRQFEDLELESRGLLLCVSGLKLVNFMRDMGGRIVAVDFDGYSFLPPSFFDFVLKGGSSNFALNIVSMLRYPSPPSTSVIERLLRAGSIF
ncbi:hypothetical protein K443DRAFT_290371 [Laccaria amethystina LaAM-08-1]|uniref:Unplaced genomic scaffold K443scaffold_19, whole genome shotgun sequence n=1 Tax=Laccaria amethystina LaAM-08-1 TaxID=1095629 RepID=A0A0C9Y7U0_9AGAR|nr:hypothetical protein K443DRAFT_290371 [Laccaria amethystina LaAM-08-1]